MAPVKVVAAERTIQGGASLRAEGVTVAFGAVMALNDVGFELEPNSRTGLIGPNGAGKTTLLNVISGFVRTASGSLQVDSRDIHLLGIRKRVELGVLRSFQTVRLLERESLFLNVLLGRQRFPHAHPLSQLLRLPSYARFEARDRTAARAVINTFGLTPWSDTPVGDLPFGMRRLVEVARVLVAEPTVTLLDEPAAGLDAASRVELGQVLIESQVHHPTTMVVVEHDVELVRNVCETAIVLDAGVKIATGRPEVVLELDVVKRTYFGAHDAED